MKHDIKTMKTQPEESMKSNVEATWSVSLNCCCPGCQEDVDLINHPDFWIDRQLEIAECRTERSQDMTVVCPECGHKFTVDCQY